jgi:hypothetical protein
MTTEITSLLNNLIVRDSVDTWRWYDAFGPNVAKLIENFVSFPISSADSPAGWTVTLVEAGAGESTIALVGGALGGSLLITTDAADNDGAQMQLQGEAFYFANRYPFYFGAKFQVSDATQSDLLIGLSITDSTAIDGVSDGLFIRKVDATTSLLAIVEKDSAESALTIATMADATAITVEMNYGIDGTLTVYVNGVEVGSFTDADVNFPDNEYLTPTVAFLAGEAVAKTMTVEWVRFIQVQAT